MRFHEFGSKTFAKHFQLRNVQGDRLELDKHVPRFWNDKSDLEGVPDKSGYLFGP